MIKSISLGFKAGRRSLLKCVVIVGMLLPLGLFQFFACQNLTSVREAVQERLARRAAALAEQMARNLDVQAAILDLFALRLAGMSAEDVVQAPALYHAFQTRVDRDRLASSVVVTDQGGQVLASDRPLHGMRIDDRAYFQRALRSTAVVVGDPVTSRMSGQQVIPVARRWDGGVVTVTLPVDGLRAMLSAQAAGLEDQPTVTVLRDDRSILAQWPSVENTGMAHAVPQLPPSDRKDGIVRYQDADGQLCVAAFYRLERYPLTVTYSIRGSTIIMAWLWKMAPLLALALVATALFVIAARVVLRKERAADKAMADGVAETARAHRAVSHFLDAATHDLCQPLQGLRLFLGVLDARLTEATDRHVLGQAFKALEGAEGLLASLRGMSRLDAGLVHPQMRDVAVGEVIAAVVDEFHDQAVARQVDLRQVACSARVRTDPELLRCMLRSLIANAIAFTRSGRVLVGGRVHGGLLRLEVWDTGIGIAPEKLDAVFEDFVQLDNPERDRRKGLGLGLALVRRLAALLGIGKGVISRPGKGSMFWLAVPLAR